MGPVAGLNAREKRKTNTDGGNLNFITRITVDSVNKRR